jgi:hypothetical protein
MLVRNRSRNRARGGGSSLSNALLTLASYGASDAWDFVADQYIRAGTVGPSGLTVTRASAGYAQRSDGIWQSFASGVARITDKGLLVEGSRQNLALWSRDFTNAAWVKGNVTAALNQTGIDGVANSASSLTATAGLGTTLQTVISLSAARATTCYVKRITGTGTIEFTSDGVAYTDITSSLSVGTWFRATVTGTITNPVLGFRITTSGDAIAVDFAQLENGAFPSSPIATEATAVTRAADAATAAQSTAYPATLYSEFSQDVLAGGNPNRIFQLDVASISASSSRSTLYLNANVLEYRVNASGGTQGTVSAAGAISANTIYKVAGRTALDDLRVYRNATQGTQDTSAALPAASTTARFGSGVSANEELFGYLRRCSVIPRALSDTELQGITT